LLRFPNPGSDIDSFIRIYKELFASLHSYESFSLDDMSNILVEKNLATSSGYMGQEALARSNREDRSRDPLYNQSKMYAELYRTLGWFHSKEESSLNYEMTYLGQHVFSSKFNISEIFKQCILGISYPNPNLEVKNNHFLRPFKTILRTMMHLDGVLSRDEMILGPLSMINDRDEIEFQDMINLIKSIRGNKKKLNSKFAALSQELKIQKNTMRNYTRFPIAVLTWTEWTEKVKNKEIYNSSMPFLKLTDGGVALASDRYFTNDVRNKDLVKCSIEDKVVIAKFSFYKMMDRSGFDLSELENELDELETSFHQISLSNKPQNDEFIFSPFQELESKFLRKHVSDFIITKTLRQNEGQDITDVGESSSVEKSITTLSLVNKNEEKKDKSTCIIQLLKIHLDKTSGDVENAIELIIRKFDEANQNEFYPLVRDLLRYIGFNCMTSRAGVNYQRWDAFIHDDIESIPIEIKSPGEEECLSVKAIRQALENKVILLSRKSAKTLLETTSLAIGFKYPNNRSDVVSLINDIKITFGITIGIIDFHTLLSLAYKSMIDGKYPKKEIFNRLYGIANA
jgi:hypothetical protein